MCACSSCSCMDPSSFLSLMLPRGPFIFLFLITSLVKNATTLEFEYRTRTASINSSESLVSNQGAGLMVQLRHNPGAIIRGRKLLRAASLGVEGSVRDVGYFYATVQLGSPAKQFQLIIDTGSTITYVPCADCKHCGKHQGEPFDPKASETAQMLGCATPKCNCGSPACQCFQNKCYYARTYAEHSSSDGFLLEDVFGFPDVPGSAEQAAMAANSSTAPPVKLVFGCEYSETGEIYKQAADGIMGLGNNNNALQSQLVEQKVISDMFSLCFGYPNGGVLLLGDVPLSKASDIIYTPMKPSWQSHYYIVTVSHMTVGGKKMNVPKTSWSQGYGSVLDSGTTFTYLPSDAFKVLLAMLEQQVAEKGLERKAGPDPQYNDVCWQGGPTDVSQLSDFFPNLDMVFEGDAVLTMEPLQYLFVTGKGSYCLGVFDNGRQGALLGGISVRNVLVQYDRKNWRAGFLRLKSCQDVQDLIVPVDKPTPEHGSAASGHGSSTTVGSTSSRGGSSGDGSSSGGSDDRQPLGGKIQKNVIPGSDDVSTRNAQQSRDGSDDNDSGSSSPLGRSDENTGDKSGSRTDDSVHNEDNKKGPEQTVEPSSNNSKPENNSDRTDSGAVDEDDEEDEEAGSNTKTQSSNSDKSNKDLNHSSNQSGTGATDKDKIYTSKLDGKGSTSGGLSQAVLVLAGVLLGASAVVGWSYRAQLMSALQSLTAPKAVDSDDHSEKDGLLGLRSIDRLHTAHGSEGQEVSLYDTGLPARNGVDKV